MKVRMGSRESSLARKQTREAGRVLQDTFAAMSIEWVWGSSPGDRDQSADLVSSPGDFFTRDLDAAVRSGELDAAVHSAKDFPSAPGLDWFWLPTGYDRRDVWVGSVSPRRVGVSSARRCAYVQARFPDAECVPLRGTIETRLAQIEAGQIDGLVMAGAALQRLELEDRIAAWIPLEELATPGGQGLLALAFRQGDPRFTRLRTLFVKPVALVSGGPSGGLCTRAGAAVLRQAEVCLYDALIDEALLDLVPASAQRVYVGKRNGRHQCAQAEICAQLVRYAREGKRVVRLKGGDAGLYGRLAEEVAALDAHDLPYQVIPGVSSMAAATTGTGLLLTRRAVTDRIHILSGHAAAAHQPTTDKPVTEVVFMGTRCLADIAKERLAAGYAAQTPLALVYGAGTVKEAVLCGTLSQPPVVPEAVAGDPGLILIGGAMDASYRYVEHGALRGRRVWLTCSAAVRHAAEQAVRDFGGRPVWQPLIRLVPEPLRVDWSAYDWLVITSPSAVRCLLAGLPDVRCLPRVLCCGPGTAAALRAARICPDAMPEGAYSTEGVLSVARTVMARDARVLRVRSDRAGPALAKALRQHVGAVDDTIVCRNERLASSLPACEAVLFASASAVESFMAQFPADVLTERMVAVMGKKECTVLNAHGIDDVQRPARSTLAGSLALLAARCVAKEVSE